MLSKHIVKIMLKLVFKDNGQTARIRNARKVIYFLFSKLRNSDTIVLAFLLIPSMFWRIIFRHLYFVKYGATQAHYFKSITNAYPMILKLKISTFVSYFWFYYFISDTQTLSSDSSIFLTINLIILLIISWIKTCKFLLGT